MIKKVLLSALALLVLVGYTGTNEKADLNVTQEIRKAIMADESLSMNAKNVKIITANGIVTLRGPVNTPQEKATIEAKAQSIAGANNVDSQLEIVRR
jgi:osmotically-inducible protein OsmY